MPASRQRSTHPFAPTPELGRQSSDDGETTVYFPHASDTGPLLGHGSAWSPSSPDPTRPLRGLARRRLHPLALLPALLVGMILALGVQHVPDEWVPEVAVTAVDTVKQAVSFTRPVETPLAPTSPLTLHSNGLAYVSPVSMALGEARHPIYDLIANATAKWEALVARQSTTLAEAVAEYRRRHSRDPPAGFDKWYEFAVANDIVLIDEYDRIVADTMPFLALPRSILRSRQAAIAKNENSHTFLVRGGQVNVTGAKAKLMRATEQRELMLPFAQWLPDMDITMSAHDGPSVLMDARTRARHTDAASRGKVLSVDEAEEVDDDPSLWGYALACEPESRMRRAFDGLEVGTLPAGPSFIHDHRAAMDMCRNPEFKNLHGFTSWAGKRPEHLQPLFSFAKMPMYSDVLMTPLEQYFNKLEVYDDPPWEKKPYRKAMWRGSTTGVWFGRDTRWRSSQRVRLQWLAQGRGGSRPVRFVERDTATGIEHMVERVVDTRKLARRHLDVAFAGEMSQCVEDDGSCDAGTAIIDFRDGEGLDWPTQQKYRYQIDVDGNAWSGRFHRLMSSNSVILKSSIFPEWYSQRIQPWVHYIPLKVDYSDLFDIMVFFAGDERGRNTHDAMAKRIAMQGKDWTEKHWRLVDMQAYAFRLYLEWARVTADDPAKAVFTMP